MSTKSRATRSKAKQPWGSKPKAATKVSSKRLAELPNVEPEVKNALDGMLSGAKGPISFGVVATPKKVVDTPTADEVSSHQQLIATENEISGAATKTDKMPAAPAKEKKTMTLTLKGKSPNGKAAIYTGAAQNVRIALRTFPDKNPPATIEVPDGVFAPAKTPKVKMTAEERKAARAARPKMTLAEKIAKREADLAALKAKAAAAEQPAL